MSYWPADVRHRAPLHDFPPAWASAWGDDRYGLWADWVVGGVTQRLHGIERAAPITPHPPAPTPESDR